MDYGFIRVAAAVPRVAVAAPHTNSKRIAAIAERACDEGVQIVVFPELSLTGYTCADLFLSDTLLSGAREALGELVESTSGLGIICIVGMPVEAEGKLYNTAVVFGAGHIYGVVPKINIPNYGEFYEGRWFTSGRGLDTSVELCGRQVRMAEGMTFECGQTVFGVELCEDLWVADSPSTHLAASGAKLIFNLSATDEVASKHDYLCDLIRMQSARTCSAYVYASAGFGESSTDLAFAGNAIIYETGALMSEGKRFSTEQQLIAADVDLEKIAYSRRGRNTFMPEPKRCPIAVAIPPFGGDTLYRHTDPMPFVPADDSDNRRRCREIFSIQCAGLMQRLDSCNIAGSVVGISGGLDSTLALLVTVASYDKLGRARKDITGITMPGFGTTDRTHDNAVMLMKHLGVTSREISIKQACIQHFKDIDLPDGDRSVTYENGQARERTQILMDYANRTGGIVIGTGDLSELALGWATYNGDQMSMYGVNAGVPKTLVRHLVRWYAEECNDPRVAALLEDIIATPISPELLPAESDGSIAQKTEDLVGPYELHDFFLYNIVRWGFSPEKTYILARNAFGDRYDTDTIKHWLRVFIRRFFVQQFKRSAMPDGVKVGSVALSPRGDWRMPSDAQAEEWLRRAEEL